MAESSKQSSNRGSAPSSVPGDDFKLSDIAASINIIAQELSRSDDFPLLPSVTSVAELMPRLDTMFADVQASIPSLDFEASSVSSDEELSIFNRSLKSPHLERDLGDETLTPEAWRQALEPSNELEDLPIQAPTYEYVKVNQDTGQQYRTGSTSFKSSMPKLEETEGGADTSPRVFSRRLPPFDSANSKTWSAVYGQDLVPKDMIPCIDDFDESEDALGNSGSSTGLSTSSLDQSTSSLQTVISSVVAESLGLDVEADMELSGENYAVDENVGESIIEMAEELPPTRIIEDEFTKREERVSDNREVSNANEERSREVRPDTTKSEENLAIVNQMLPPDAPTLAIEKVDFIDLDLLIDAFPERANDDGSLGRPPSAHSDAGADGSGLMDKLTQLCIQQSGGKISRAELSPTTAKSGNSKTTQGLAAKPPRPPPKVVWEEKTSPRRVSTSTGTSPPKMNRAVPAKTASTGTSMHMDHSIVEVGETPRRRAVGLQRSRETVFLDLRPKEDRKKETAVDGQAKAVQRILNLHTKKTEHSSSDESSDEEDSALGWHEKRRKVMQKLGQVKGQPPLTSGGRQASEKEREAARDKEPMRSVVSKPHRVIHIVHSEETTSRDSGTQTTSTAVPVQVITECIHLPPTPPQSPASPSSRTPQRRPSGQTDSDPSLAAAAGGAAGAKQRELGSAALAKRLREQKERERQERQKLQRKLEGLHPQMTPSTRRKEAARATDVVFDLEASYKPESLLLPPALLPNHETLLLTVTMTTSGNILLGKSSSGRQLLDRPDGQISATYIVLLSWLLSLVPRNFDYLTDDSLQAPCTASGTDNIPFRVVGLQQIWKGNKLQLQAAITPPCMDTSKQSPVKQKRGKLLREEVRDMTAFQQTVSKFLTSKNLHTVAAWMPHAFRFVQEFSGEPLELPVMPMDSPRERITETGTYVPAFPQVSSKPLATYVSMSMSPCAVEGAFNAAPGFFWRTLDAEESMYEQLTSQEYDGNMDTQNTLTVLHDAVYHHPSKAAGVFLRILQEGLDISGFRLMYNSADMLTSPRLSGRNPNDVNAASARPLVVMAIRGNMARTRLLDAVGPSDPLLARRTDPYSLMALYGGTSRDDLTIVCPRNPSRINYELALWFGARGTNDKSKDAVFGTEALPQSSGRRVRSESPKAKKGRKGSRKDSWSNGSNEDLDAAGLPPATLVATTTGDAVLAISPLVPPMCLGVILSTCQERGYQLRGIKRLRLNAKRAAALGLQGKQVSVFSPMSCSTPTSPKNCEEALRKRLEAGLPASTNPPLPSTLVHLRAENAVRNAGSLVQALMVQLSRQGLLPTMQANAEMVLRAPLCFHIAAFSDALFTALGGDFSRIPEHDVYHGVSVPSTFYSNPELEQIVVVTFSRARTLKLLGNTLGKLLGVFPVTSTNNVSTPRCNPGEGLELLGIKFLPSLTTFQSKELTPFEVGDRSWQPSVHSLASSPAAVCMLRGINAFHHVRSMLKIPTHPTEFRRGSGSGGDLGLERLMSASAEIAFRQAAMFFRDHELFADPSMRANLPYQPPLRSPSLEELSNARFAWAEDHSAAAKKAKHRGGGAQNKGTVLVEESIFKTMLAGPRPITTVLVIKPGALRHLAKILKRISQEDFLVVALRLLSLSNRQAKALVPDEVAENDVVCGMHLDHLRSGPVLALALQRENAVRKLLSVLGPASPKEAKRQNEFLWRGMFGADPINNAFHGSQTYLKAVEEQRLLFPEGLCCRLTSDLKADQISCPAVDCIMGGEEATKRSFMLRMATPGSHGDGSPEDHSSYLNGGLSPRSSIGVGTTTTDLTFHSHSALCQTNCILLTPPLQLLSVQGHRKGYVDVIDCLRHRGFDIVGARMVWFSPSQAKEFVSIYSGAFPNLIQLLCHGPSIVLAIQRDNAVSCLGSLLGNLLDPEAVINKYGKHILRPKDTKEAIKHLEFFFDELVPGSQGEIVHDSTPLGYPAS
ncbi:dynein axonemal assembly factor 8-like [Diadema antillarum]|uniref:dynein axonemal assembly factor 8-like n=1 Tax=Diadema antillarum TaxID=105358 RepID=UPI003A8AB9A3